MVIYSFRKKRLYKRFGIIVLVFLFLFVLAYYTGFLRENCGTDIGCFEERASTCKPADVMVLRDTNVYEYSIRSSVGDCDVHVKLVRVAAGTSEDLQDLVGKKMVCGVPTREMEGFTVDSFEGSLEYCHGELKEGLLELVLKRVYANMIGQMGSILEEVS